MSQPRLHDAGKFNRQLTIEDCVKVSDGFGGFSNQYIAVGSAWAQLCPEITKLEIAADRKAQKSSHRVVIRFRTGIVPGTRFVTGSRRFEVATVSDPDETRRYLECLVIEQ